MADAIRLAILGSTGSIGQQTLDIVRALPSRFQVLALAAGNNTGLLERQVSEFKPSIVYHHNGALIQDRHDFDCMNPEDMVAVPEVDLVVMAISGQAGLLPTVAAVKAGKRIALANKESLVMAGELVTVEARHNEAQILPVDSEHSAIWQCLAGEPSRPERLILTASGGPFRNKSRGELSEVTPEQALRHPSWNMGKKVTIDSATLMNKGLEVMEARWLFSMPIETITVLIHPQSIIHSMVEFGDGAIKAQLGCPDMRLPIQYALCYPERVTTNLPRLDFNEIKSLVFETPDTERFPCLRLAIEAGMKGGTYPAVLSAADEIAVSLFLEGLIGFADIAYHVEKTLGEHVPVTDPVLDDILAAADWARRNVLQIEPRRDFIETNALNVRNLDV